MHRSLLYKCRVDFVELIRLRDYFCIQDFLCELVKYMLKKKYKDNHAISDDVLGVHDTYYFDPISYDTVSPG